MLTHWQAPKHFNCWQAPDGILQPGLPVKGAGQTEFGSKPVPNITWQFHCEHEPYWISVIFHHYLPKVNRCLARYSPRTTTTNQPTDRAPNEPARTGKNANFGPNLDVFGQKIPIFTGEIKSFVTHISENPPSHLVHIGFWSRIEKKGKKGQYLAENDQKCIFFILCNPNF